MRRSTTPAGRTATRYVTLGFSGFWVVILVAMSIDFCRRRPWILLLGAAAGAALVAIEAMTEDAADDTAFGSIDGYLPEACPACAKLGYACGSDHA